MCAASSDPHVSLGIVAVCLQALTNVSRVLRCVDSLAPLCIACVVYVSEAAAADSAAVAAAVASIRRWLHGRARRDSDKCSASPPGSDEEEEEDSDGVALAAKARAVPPFIDDECLPLPCQVT